VGGRSSPADALVGGRSSPADALVGGRSSPADELSVRVVPNQASGAVTSLAWADALAIIPPETTSLDPGDIVRVLRIADA
jgi:molybdopterin biosynthesis enzyme